MNNLKKRDQYIQEELKPWSDHDSSNEVKPKFTFAGSEMISVDKAKSKAWDAWVEVHKRWAEDEGWKTDDIPDDRMKNEFEDWWKEQKLNENILPKPYKKVKCTGMYKIYKLFEFVDLNKIYPYRLVDTWMRCFYTYEFESNGTIYNLLIINIPFKPIEISWGDKESFDIYMSNFKRGRTSKMGSIFEPNTMNFNQIEYILNTIFKILFEFIDKYNIKKIKISSYAKSKYKTYKRIILDRPEFEIIKDFKSIKQGKEKWSFIFIPKI
jgi:hypothetical protein